MAVLLHNLAVVDARDASSNDTAPIPPSPQNVDFGTREIGWQALGPAIACTALATIAVALRWYTRWKISRCLGRDDVVILFSMVLTWCMCAIIGAELHEGMGVYSNSRMIDHPHLAKLAVTNNDIWALAVNATKASILVQYLRIFSDRVTRTCCWILMALLVPAVTWAIFGGTFLCRPVAKLWHPDLPGTCLSAEAYWLSAAGINIGLDFLVLILPLPGVTKLRLPRKQKICLVAVFLLGFFVCLVSVVRLATVWTEVERGNFVESGVQAIIWSIVEANVGIICACLVAYKPLLVKYFPSMFEEHAVPEHCMRLPMVETSDGGTSGAKLCAPPTNSQPTSPSTSKSRDTFTTMQRSSIAATINGAPQAEGLSFLDMLASGPGEGSRTLRQ
nr:hypothetical protein B0A51_07753 [Rachicladosporium sp. CCFEE 5018]